MRIKVTYEVDFENYLFLEVGNCPDGIYNNAILEQEKTALISLISEKFNPGHNIQIEEV